MQMFDEEIATLIKTDGTVEQKHWLTEDTLAIRGDATRVRRLRSRRAEVPKAQH